MKSLTRHFAILPMVCALACGGEELHKNITASVVVGGDERPTDLSDANVLHARGEDQEESDGWVKLWTPSFQMTFRHQIGKQDCKPTAQAGEDGTTLSPAMIYQSAATGECGRENAIRCEIDVQALPGKDGGPFRVSFSSLLECRGGKPALELKNGTFEIRGCSDEECFVPLSY